MGAPRLWSGVGRGSEVHGGKRFLSRRKELGPASGGQLRRREVDLREARTDARISRDQLQQAVEDSRLDCLLIRDPPLVDVGRIRNVGRGSAWTLSHRLAVGSRENGPSGGPVSIGGGVTISWSGVSVNVAGGSATICVEAGTSNSGVLTSFGPGTYTLTCAEFGCNPQGQPPIIKHVQWIPVTTTTTTSTSATTSSTTTATQTTRTSTTQTSTTSTTSTTETSTTTSDTVEPTTVSPSSSTTPPEVAPTTVSPGGTAFTGVENLVPLGAIALMLVTSGSGLLWASSRRRRNNAGDEE